MNKILLIRVDALGDLIQTLPAIKAIQEYYKDAELDMMVRHDFVSFMHETDLVHTVLPWNKKAKIQSIINLRKRKYDTVYDLTTASTYDSSLLLLFAQAKEKIGYAVGIRKYWLTRPIMPTTLQYERDMVLEICRQMNIPIQKDNLFFPVSSKKKKESIIKIEGLLTKEYGWKRKMKKMMAIHPSASKKEKMWPPEKFIAVLNKIIEKDPQVCCVFIGTSEERQLCEHINNQLTSKQIVLAGELSITELGVFLSCCNLLLCNNSGPMHIASSVGIPLIILNMVSSQERWNPKNGKVWIFNATPEDLEQQQMQKAVEEDIRVDDVYAACLEALGY